MASQSAAGLTLINAQLAGGDIGSLRIVDSRIAAIREPPHAGDRIVHNKRLLLGFKIQ